MHTFERLRRRAACIYRADKAILLLESFITMPIELQIIRAQEFIRLGAHGRFDLKASKAVLAQLAAACWKRGINQALLDLRALHPGPKPVFSPKDLVVLVNTFREVGFTHQERLAVLYSDDPHRRARMFATIAKQRGWSVQAFDSFEAAVHWLSAATPKKFEEEPDFTAKPKKIPVRIRKTLKVSTKPAVRPVIQIKSKSVPPRDPAPLKPGQGKRANILAAVLALVAGMTTTLTAQPAAEAPVVVANTNPATPLAAASPFAPTIPNATPAPTNAPAGMGWIPGGEFSMGSLAPNEGICSAATMSSLRDAQPIHRVYVDGFWMDKTDVTNDEFEKFVKATGYVTIAEIVPVAQFPPNGYGLYDMAGNVWQWCSDWYRPDTYARLKLAGVGVARNPQGPATSYNPGESQPQRVHRGGSFLCMDEYCTRYLMGTRGKGDVDTGSNHLGFRCVKDVATAP